MEGEWRCDEDGEAGCGSKCGCVCGGMGWRAATTSRRMTIWASMWAVAYCNVYSLGLRMQRDHEGSTYLQPLQAILEPAHTLLAQGRTEPARLEENRLPATSPHNLLFCAWVLRRGRRRAACCGGDGGQRA
jgi:hypothetical protein